MKGRIPASRNGPVCMFFYERKGELQTFLPAVFSGGTGKGKLMPGADRVYIQLQAFRITIKGKGEKYVEMQ